MVKISSQRRAQLKAYQDARKDQSASYLEKT